MVMIGRILLHLGCLLIAGCASTSMTGDTPLDGVPVSIEFGSGLVGMDGAVADLKHRKASLVFLHFWGTWCTNCVEELHVLKKLQEELAADGVLIIAIAIDDKLERVRKVANELGSPFPFLFDTTGETRKKFGVTGVPMSELRAPEGYVLTMLDPESQLRERSIVGPRAWLSATFIEDIRAMAR
jgi:cytochrome c biogenesis protein CcmG, thiol:disulfide interchange protein DsbE